ncbi:MAG: UDP-N-acetylglucosamine--N-acetylmuramyl-(pentapeptide) pyrophosphoryl-undecaprenol N-acetylglucosamine transferase, partial [Bacteroidales bacterium]|nr:UDP-N-acetylglucosamine--N-acetylmuramyl-(pentapeptide) pyrophosphoryl-undecaprenol N-acetylglucosamine transferase [Bacteroidales bacterium]
TKNAMALVDKGAAAIVYDKDAKTTLIPALDDLINNSDKQRSMSLACSSMGVRDAAYKIVDEIEKVIGIK